MDEIAEDWLWRHPRYESVSLREWEKRYWMWKLDRLDEEDEA